VTKPGGKVLKVPLGAGQWRSVKEMLKRNARYQSPNQSAKSILLELAEISSANPAFGPILAQLGPCGPIQAQLGPVGPSPSPARAPVHSPEKNKIKKGEKKADLFPSRETVRPEAGFETFTAELQGILNAAGCAHRLHDQAAIRAVFDRMNPPSPALGAPATEDQVRDFVQAKATELGGTDYSSGLVLPKLLDARFWGRRGTIGAKSRGKRQEGARQAEQHAEAQRRRDEAQRRLAAQSRARKRQDSVAPKPADDNEQYEENRRRAREALSFLRKPKEGASE